MILNGLDNLTTVEIVDLSSSTTVCDNLPNYPYAIRGTSGGLLDNKIPLVCGGISVQDCFQYREGKWEATFPMNENHFHFSSMPSSPYKNESHRFFLLGGGEPPALSVEVLTNNGWEVTGSQLPRIFHGSCMVSVNETTIMLIAGSLGNGKLLTETFIFNSLTNVWVSGPPILSGRRFHGCGYIKENGQSKSKIIIAAGGTTGGWEALNSVEFLDGIDGSWRSGEVYILMNI